MSRRLARTALVGAVIALGLASLTSPVWSVQQDDARRLGTVRSDLKGELHVLKPVPIAGPYPDIPHEVHPGDVICMQLSYPISPPFPSELISYSDSPAATPVGDFAVRAPGKLVTLSGGQGAQGQIGVGYITVLGRASQTGTATITCEVKAGDGKPHVIPFKIRVVGEDDSSSR